MGFMHMAGCNTCMSTVRKNKRFSGLSVVIMFKLSIIQNVGIKRKGFVVVLFWFVFLSANDSLI